MFLSKRQHPPLLLETTIETRTCAYAFTKGVLILKLNVQGRRGWPDRLFINKGRIALVEFKRPGVRPTVHQKWIHERLSQHGFKVSIVDSLAGGKRLVDILLESPTTGRMP